MNKLLIPALALCGALVVPLVAQDKGKNDDKPVPAPAPAAKNEPYKVGSTVDEKLTLTDLDGKAIDFKSLRGKVVIVHFWSDRCPAEIHGNPVFKKLETYYADRKDVVLIGVVANQNELGAAPAKDADYSKCYTNFRDKIKETGFTHKICADHGNKLSDRFGATCTPHCFVIDAKGVLAYAGALDDDQRGSKGEAAKVYVRNAADALLAGKTVEVKETKPYG